MIKGVGVIAQNATATALATPAMPAPVVTKPTKPTTPVTVDTSMRDSTTTANTTTTAAIAAIAARPAFAVTSWQSSGSSLSGWNPRMAYGAKNLQFAPDPSGGGNVMKVRYPAGSYVPNGRIIGGVGFKAKPLSVSGASQLTLEYQVYFPSGFNFVMGGKLPGLYAGPDRGCSGGASAKNCFLVRLMVGCVCVIAACALLLLIWFGMIWCGMI